MRCLPNANLGLGRPLRREKAVRAASDRPHPRLMNVQIDTEEHQRPEDGCDQR